MSRGENGSVGSKWPDAVAAPRQTGSRCFPTLTFPLTILPPPTQTLNLAIMGKRGPSLRDTVVKQGVQFALSVRQFTPSLARIPSTRETFLGNLHEGKHP